MEPFEIADHMKTWLQILHVRFLMELLCTSFTLLQSIHLFVAYINQRQIGTLQRVPDLFKIVNPLAVCLFVADIKNILLRLQ